MPKVRALTDERFERLLLGMYLLLHAALLLAFAGFKIGYDIDGHMRAIALVTWEHAFPALRAGYYVHHPPLGFLLARSIVDLGIPGIIAAQLVSFAASIGAFWFMRKTLKELGLLSYPQAIAFLYVGASIPMQLYLSFAISLDVLVLCFASIVLYCSVKLFWNKERSKRRPLWIAGLMIALAAGFASKVSGLTLFAIPLLAALAGPGHSRRAVSDAILISAAAAIPVMCFLYFRYYVPEHTWLFNSAGASRWVNDMAAARASRDEHSLLFAFMYVLDIGRGAPYLLPTWESLWRMVDAPAPSLIGDWLQSVFSGASLVLCMIGAALTAGRRMLHGAWKRFGSLMLGFFAVQLAAICYYIFSQPLPGYFSNKGIYIASASWCIAFFLAVAAHALLPIFVPASQERRNRLLLWGTAAFLVLQHAILLI